MRTEEDIKNIMFTFLGKFQIDMERVEEDPTWTFFNQRVESGILTQEEALRLYLTQYLTREEFPRELPVTNGPADFIRLELEVINASNTGRSEHSEG